MKVSIVCGVWMSNDAISDVIALEIAAMQAIGIDDVEVFTYSCDRVGVSPRIVSGLDELLFDPHFQRSDFVILHFGVFYPLFDALAASPSNARRIVVFHNVTPKAFVAPSNHATIDRSLVQISNIAWADHVLCDSETNLDALRGHGIRTPATVNALAVQSLLTAPPAKPGFSDRSIRLAFVGRFVQSKGPQELLAAVDAALRSRPDQSLQLDLIGNLHFSDRELVKRLERTVADMNQRHGPRASLRLHGNASDDLKRDVLRNADLFVLPTYHEGFCVPVLEAFAGACRVLSYDNSNLPAICGGLARLTRTGDGDALTAALIEEIDLIGSSAWRDGPDGYAAHVRRTAEYVGTYSPDHFKTRFARLLRQLAGRPIRRPVAGLPANGNVDA